LNEKIDKAFFLTRIGTNKLSPKSGPVDIDMSRNKELLFVGAD